MQEKHGKEKGKEKARERVERGRKERKGRTPLGVVTWLYAHAV